MFSADERELAKDNPIHSPESRIGGTQIVHTNFGTCGPNVDFAHLKEPHY